MREGESNASGYVEMGELELTEESECIFDIFESSEMICALVGFCK